MKRGDIWEADGNPEEIREEEMKKERFEHLKKSLEQAIAYERGEVEMDIATLQELIETIETIEGIRRGLESKKRSEGKSLEEFDAEMRKKRNIPRKPRIGT